MKKKLIFSSILILLISMDTYSQSRRIELLGNVKFDHWSNRSYNNKHQLLSSSYCIVPSKTTSNDRGVYNMKRLFLKSLGLLGEIESRRSLFNSNPGEPQTGLYKNDARNP